MQAGYDVASVRPDRAVVYADDEELANSAGCGMGVRSSRSSREFGKGARGLPWLHERRPACRWTTYAAAYHALAASLSLGKSVQNRDLWARKITTDPDLPQDKPRFRYLAAMHEVLNWGTGRKSWF